MNKILLLGTVILAGGQTEATAEGEHATSDYMHAAIASGLPRFDPKPAAAAPDPKAGAAASRNAGSPGVSTLPAFIVREDKVPRRDEVMTDAAKVDDLMNRYVGPANGFDRGVLNRFTLAELWRKIPVLGSLPFIGSPVQMSKQERALDASGANDTIPYPHPPPAEKE